MGSPSSSDSNLSGLAFAWPQQQIGVLPFAVNTQAPNLGTDSMIVLAVADSVARKSRFAPVPHVRPRHRRPVVQRILERRWV